MSSFEKFEDIEAWKLARVLVKEIYLCTRASSFSKDYALSSQIQRAAVSVMSNIAEGFERGGNKEFIQFLYIAKGSAGEVRSQLYTALDLNYITEDYFKRIYETVLKISKLISGLINYLKNSNYTGEKYKP